MKKEELEAILSGGGYDLDLGPIEAHLHAVASERRLPKHAIAQCVIRIEESAPTLLAVLQRAADGETLSEDEATLLFRSLYILGGAQNTQACRPLLRLLRRPVDELDYLLGDGVTEGLPRIAAGVFDGDAEALFDHIVDRSIDHFIRYGLLGAATFLTWRGLIERERTERFLVLLYEGRLAEDGDQVWIGWLKAIALLGLRHLAPLVRNAWDEGRVPPGMLDRRDFEQDLVDAEQRPDDVERFYKLNLGYVEGVVEALEWTDRIEDPPDAPFDEEDLLGDNLFVEHDGPMEPVRNPLRHVGRHDPCPCGSGKKAKKCCLARQD